MLLSKFSSPSRTFAPRRRVFVKMLTITASALFGLAALLTSVSAVIWACRRDASGRKDKD